MFQRGFDMFTYVDDAMGVAGDVTNALEGYKCIQTLLQEINLPVSVNN